MGTIVCGYDGSDPCREALEQAAELAGSGDDSLVVVFGFPVSRLGGEVPDYAAALHERAAEVEKHAEDRAATRTFAHDLPKIGKRRVDDLKPHFAREARLPVRDGLRIAVEREHAAFSTQGL